MSIERTTLNISTWMTLLLLSSFCLVSSADGQETQPEPKITYEDHVKPILTQRCSTCHGGGKKEGDLDAINYTNLMLGGGSGEVISPGSADASFLYQLITHADSPEMPPGGTKIPNPEIKIIADWINQGARENAGSKPGKSQPKLDLSLSQAVTTRPEVVPFPLRLPLEPVMISVRPSVTAIATSPWAHLAAIASPKQILLYDTQSLELIGVFPMDEGLAHSLRFSRNGSLLLAGGGINGQSGRTILWDVTTGERVTAIGEELDTVLTADVSSNHALVALGGPKMLVKVFSITDDSLVYEIAKHTDWITAIEFSPDGKYLATGDRNGGLIIWESETGNEMFVLKAHTKSISGVSWRADSKILASASEDMTVRTWEMNRGGQVKSWNAHADGVTAMEFMRDGNLVTCGRDKLAKTWDQNGQLLKEYPGLSDVAVAVSYCDETNRILSGDWSGKLVVWNAADGAQLGNLAANPPSLAQRLTVAEQNLSDVRERHAPLAAQLAQTQSKLTEASTALAGATQTRSQKEFKITETGNQLAAIKQRFESTSTQLEQWRQELSEKSNAQPLIEQTFTKAVEAAEALPADKEMKQSVAQLESKTKQIETRIAELDDLIAKSDQEKNSSQTEIDGLTATLESGRQELENMNSQVALLESEVLQLSQQAESESAAATATQQAVEAAQRRVNKWKNEIDFIEQLKGLNGQLLEIQKIALARQAVVDQAQEKLKAAQRTVDEARRQRQSIESQTNELRQKILQLRGGG